MGAARKDFERERDKNITTELYLKGFSTRAIAKRITEIVGDGYSTTHKTVSFDVKALLKQWSADRIHNINDQKMIALEKLDRLEQTYWEAWEKSVENHKKVSQKMRGQVGKNSPEYLEKTEMDMREFGEPRYLQGVERCIDKRCKLLGLDAPIKMEQQDNSFLHFLMHTE